MTPDEIRELIRQTSNQSTQRQSAALDALGSALGGIEELKKFGFFFELVIGTMQQPQEWPKMVYHGEKPPAVVYSEEELGNLGEGWTVEQPEAGEGPGPTEPYDPRLVVGATGTDPTLVPVGGMTGAMASGGANMPPPPEASLSPEALASAKEAGRQAKKDGKDLSEAPDGPSADAWRQGYTEEAAWEQHDAMVQDPPHPSEEPPPSA